MTSRPEVGLFGVNLTGNALSALLPERVPRVTRQQTLMTARVLDGCGNSAGLSVRSVQQVFSTHESILTLFGGREQLAELPACAEAAK